MLFKSAKKLNLMLYSGLLITSFYPLSVSADPALNERTYNGYADLLFVSKSQIDNRVIYKLLNQPPSSKGLYESCVIDSYLQDVPYAPWSDYRGTFYYRTAKAHCKYRPKYQPRADETRQLTLRYAVCSDGRAWNNIYVDASNILRACKSNPCPPNTIYNSDTGQCESYSIIPTPPPQTCGSGNDPDSVFNPCSPTTGNKFQTETDYSSTTASSLNFSRHYSSQGINRHSNYLAPSWRHNHIASMNSRPENDLVSIPQTVGYDETVEPSNFGSPEDACLQGFAEIRASVWGGNLSDASAEYAGGELCRIYKDTQTLAWFRIRGNLGVVSPIPPSYHIITTASGMNYMFREVEAGLWKDDRFPAVKLEPAEDNWIFTDADNSKQTFNASGQLTLFTRPSGRNTSYAYDLSAPDGGDDNPKTLDRITNAAGRSLAFHYSINAEDKPRLNSLDTPDGTVSYGYDENNNLTQVTYPDGTGKTYHYENPDYPYHLTGITDENNIRFATWAYNANGKVILSKHANDAEKGQLIYNADGTTTVIGPLGDTLIYHFQAQNGRRVVSEVTGDRCSSCGNGFMKTRSYDARGFLSGYTDWNGNQTTLDNNLRGLTEIRIDAVSTAQERTLLTEWHSDFNKPVLITELGKTTQFGYNTSGQLLSQTIRDISTDKTRTISYTYHPQASNGAGLIATIDGPRLDIEDITLFNYNANGDLASVSNALGHTTTLSNHDTSGRPQTITDANAQISLLDYNARGWIKSRNQSGQITLFDYDKVGQLRKLTQPTGAYLEYTYDAAHRLSDINDNLGNTLHYTLDAMGNRKNTELTDPSGNLTRLLEQEFDKLSQLQLSIGGEGQITRFDYDLNGNQSVITDPRDTGSDRATAKLIVPLQTDNSRHSLYDALNRLISVNQIQNASDNSDDVASSYQ